MMKKLLLSICTVLFVLSAFAQAPLPTSVSYGASPNQFGGTFSEAGWTYYNAGGVYSPYVDGSIKLYAVGHYVLINTADQPGVTTFTFAAGGGSNFAGTLKVQASDVATGTFTDVSQYTATTGYQTFSIPQSSFPAGTRFVKFILTVKNTGINAAIRSIGIAAAIVTTPEINVKYNGTSVLNGQTTPSFSSPVSTTTPVSFTIENTGTLDPLEITSAALSGADAADFALNTTTPLTVTSGTSNGFVIDFTPSTSGTRNATLTLSTNDPDEASYVINLYGVGGTLASEPGVPTSLAFTGGSNYVKTFRIRGSFATGAPAIDGSGGYLVLRKTGATNADIPADGTNYTVGDMVGAYQVVANTTSTSFISNSVLANTTYNFKVFAYNGSGSARNYSAGIDLDVTTPAYSVNDGASTIATEYSAINTANATFIDDLKNRVRTSTPSVLSIFYSNYASSMIEKFASRDTAGGVKALTCVYSGNIVTYSVFSYSGLDFSREHTFAHSWMPTNPADGSGAAPNNVERPEYNDQHHLFPTKQTGVNELRCNYPFGNVVTVEQTAGGAKLGLDANGKRVFEPRASQKGDVARALFYMCLRYDGVNGADGSPKSWNMAAPNGKQCLSTLINYNQDQDVLKAWHQADPPSSYEVSRNDFLDSLQRNRNPFVDHPEYACNIDFNTMTKITNAGAVTACTTPTDMIFSSAQYTEAQTVSVNGGSTRNQVLRVSINTVGTTPALTVTQFNFTTTGTTNPSADIASAELFSTGTSTSFATTTQFGSAVAAPSGNFSFTGSKELLSGGNQFWLTYDIVAAAGNNNDVINATLASVVVGSTQTASLSGTVSGRTIVNTTSISELVNGEKLILAPNPSSSVFTISYANLSNEKTFAYRVIDITGKEVLSNTTNAVSGLNIYPVDVTSIAKGLYFVECVVGNEKVTNKIVVE